MANVMGFSNVIEDSSWRQGFADAIRANWLGTLAQQQDDNWALESITIGYIAGNTIQYSVEQGFTNGVLTGTVTGDGMPTTNALLVSLQALAQSPSRGRVYFVGFNESTQSNGYWTTAALTAAENLLTTFVQGVGPNGQDAFLRIVGRPKDGRPNYVSSQVTNIIPRTIAATQRRRRLAA